ncbi:hypothetical protein K0U07_01675 [bacterium]|nr:hypothetical protein [bacterium]
MSQIKPDPEFVPRTYQMKDMEGRVITIEDRSNSQKIITLAAKFISPSTPASSLTGRVSAE